MKYPLISSSPLLLVLMVILIYSSGCDEMNQEIYEPPDWLKGKLITQMKTRDELSTFISVLNKTGYDTILNTSGSFTVFAPTNDAMEQFFNENPEYKGYLNAESQEDKLKKLVEYQVIFNSWNKNQFSELDVYGWIDRNDDDAEPGGYKRETILQPSNKKYHVLRGEYNYQITKPENSSLTKIAYAGNRKFVPIFFDELLNIHQLNGDDYQYYFNRPFDNAKLYYAGAGFEEGIPAENGYIYITDKVNLPLENAEELLENGADNNSYDEFLHLVYQFSELVPDFTATYEQEAALAGLDFDTLFSVHYPDLTFNISSEITGDMNNANNTVRYHHGLIAPTDQAIHAFFDQYLNEWGNIDALPKVVKEIIVNTHMTKKPVYPSYFQTGIVNGEGDSVYINPGAIIQKEYASNCTFLGVNEMIVPRALNGVSRPLYLTNEYTTTLYAVEYTGVLSALKKRGVDYSFFIAPDLNIGMAGDSTLVREVYNAELDLYRFYGYSSDKQKFNYTETDLRLMLLNQIGENVPEGSANKEFIRNLAGNYIIIDNVNKTASGTRSTGEGTVADMQYQPFEMEIDNGQTYKVNAFFRFNRAASYYGFLLSNYSKFQALLQKSGLFNPSFSSYPFLDKGEKYTLFAPTDEALEGMNTDTLTKEELIDFVRAHFVRGELIFTDGKMPAKSYPTLHESDDSQSLANTYSKIYIQPKNDVIEILDNTGELYISIPEGGGKTNNMIVTKPIQDSESQWNFVTTGVIHGIDSVLMINKLKIN